jgi:hypothetical protein
MRLDMNTCQRYFTLTRHFFIHEVASTKIHHVPSRRRPPLSGFLASALFLARTIKFQSDLLSIHNTNTNSEWIFAADVLYASNLNKESLYTYLHMLGVRLGYANNSIVPVSNRHSQHGT